MSQNHDSDDEDLQRAIALSLQEDHAAYDTVDESDTEAPVPTAITKSANTGSEEHVNGKAIIAIPDSQTRADDAKTRVELNIATGMNGFAGMDRKVMEADRLARLAARTKDRQVDSTELKRKAPISPPPPPKRAKFEDTSAPSKRSIDFKPVASHLRFPRGVIKKTFSPHHIDDPGIKIEEILDRDNVNIAVLSSFIINPDWIFSKFNIKRTKFYMVLHANKETDRQMYEEDFRGLSQIKLCLPELSGIFAAMHSKLMLLFFDGFLRIVVPTANLTDFDWGETGIMENSTFLIDLPRLDREKQKEEDLPLFAQELRRFLKAQSLQQEVLDGILKFDFEATKRLAFVHTSSGFHYGDNMSHTGLTGLSRSLRQLGLETQDTIQLDFASSSLGSVNDSLINNIYAAAQGKDIVRNRELLKKPSVKVKANMRIYFPTHDTVKTSLGRTAGTICLQRQHFEKSDFPKSLLRDYVSTRHGLLSHNKIMLITGNKAWAYVGSANLSESAWGRIVLDKGRKESKLTCMNWECGVVIPVEGIAKSDDLGKAFKGVLDVPFQHGKADLEYKGREPWFFKE